MLAVPQSLAFLTSMQIVTFAIVYTIGNILSVSGTMFLMGPCKQVQATALAVLFGCHSPLLPVGMVSGALL